MVKKSENSNENNIEKITKKAQNEIKEIIEALFAAKIRKDLTDLTKKINDVEKLIPSNLKSMLGDFEMEFKNFHNISDEIINKADDNHEYTKNIKESLELSKGANGKGFSEINSKTEELVKKTALMHEKTISEINAKMKLLFSRLYWLFGLQIAILIFLIFYVTITQ